jgi:hypothetical protein
MTAKERVDHYKRALKYLDGCGPLTIDKLRESQQIAGTPVPETQLRQMWDSAAIILSSNNEPGGHEYLRTAMRKTLTEGISLFQKLGALESSSNVQRKWWKFWK